jgi:hypothetical protein
MKQITRASNVVYEEGGVKGTSDRRSRIEMEFVFTTEEDLDRFIGQLDLPDAGSTPPSSGRSGRTSP